ncbi:hypothetical protein ACFL23_01540 [Patescibacteria group bacterium]
MGKIKNVFNFCIGALLTAVGAMIVYSYKNEIARFIGNRVADVKKQIEKLKIYYFCLFVAVCLDFLYILSFGLTEGGKYTGIGFLIAVVLFVLSFTPISFALTGVNIVAKGKFGDIKLFPPLFGYIVFWLCSFGLIATLYPITSSSGIFIICFLLISGLLSAFGAMVGHKSNRWNYLALFVIIGMVAIYSAKLAMPNFYKVQERYINSTAKSVFSWQNRDSIKKETYAATTWGILKRDVDMLYDANIVDGNIIDLIPINLPKVVSEGGLLKMFAPDEKSKIFQGQNFVEVQLETVYGTGRFVGGKKYWIEANFCTWGSGTQVVPGEYSIITTNEGKTKRVNFYSSDAIKVFEWKKGEEILFTTETQGNIYMNNPNVSSGTQKFIPLPLNFPMIAKSNQSIIIKYKKGGILYINKT